MLGAGKRSEQIKIIEKGSTSDGMGGTIPGADVTVLETFAKVEPVKATAEIIAKYPEMIGTTKFKILYRQDVEITDSMFIQWRGREAAITGIEPGLTTREQITILAKFSNKTTDNGDPA